MILDIIVFQYVLDTWFLTANAEILSVLKSTVKKVDSYKIL